MGTASGTVYRVSCDECDDVAYVPTYDDANVWVTTHVEHTAHSVTCTAEAAGPSDVLLDRGAIESGSF